MPTPLLTANKVTVGNTDWGNAMSFLAASSVVRALQAAENGVLLAGINFHNGTHSGAQRRTSPPAGQLFCR